AQHLALARDPPDPAVALELEAAARSALRRGASLTAASLAEQAITFAGDDHERLSDRTLLASDALQAAGELGRAVATVEAAAAALPAGRARARLLIERAALLPNDA